MISFLRDILGKTIVWLLSKKNGVLIFYDDKERAKVMHRIKEIKKENELKLRDNEAYQLFMAVKRTSKVEGDIAEVGVYKGGSAKLICEAKQEKVLHLFDTFEGLPKISAIDELSRFFKGKYLASFEAVKEYVKKYSNVYFYKGFFPATAQPIKNKKFSFVHLDADIYQTTKDALEFFYPRMNAGGIIVSHDYINTPGIRKAFDEFFENKPEPIIELSGSQCMMVKINRV